MPTDLPDPQKIIIPHVSKLFKMSFKPNKNRVLILLDAPETKMSENVIISEWRRTSPNKGTVIAIGTCPDWDNQPEVGDHVMLHPNHNGQEIEVDSVKHLLVHIENILGKYAKQS